MTRVLNFCGCVLHCGTFTHSFCSSFALNSVGNEHCCSVTARSKFDGAGSRSVGAGAAGSSIGDDATRRTADDGDSACASGGGQGAAMSGVGGGSSGFRSGLMVEGDSSAFGGTLGQIEENGGGGAEDMELENAVAGSADGGVLRQQQQVGRGVCMPAVGLCGLAVAWWERWLGCCSSGGGGR